MHNEQQDIAFSEISCNSVEIFFVCMKTNHEPTVPMQRHQAIWFSFWAKCAAGLRSCAFASTSASECASVSLRCPWIQHGLLIVLFLWLKSGLFYLFFRQFQLPKIFNSYREILSLSLWPAFTLEWFRSCEVFLKNPDCERKSGERIARALPRSVMSPAVWIDPLPPP